MTVPIVSTLFLKYLRELYIYELAISYSYWAQAKRLALAGLNDIIALPDTDKSHILYTIDNLLASVKTRLAYK